jgi:hypothetical protein
MNGRARYLAALVQRLKGGESAANWSETRRAIKVHLEECVSGHARLDPEIAQFLILTVDLAENGEVPGLFAVKKPANRPKLALASCIEAAGTYIVFCLAHTGRQVVDGRGRVLNVDRAPVQTVVKEFQVHERTAKLWKKKAQLGRSIDDYIAVREMMLASSKHYPRLGAISHSAIRLRAKGAKS